MEKSWRMLTTTDSILIDIEAFITATSPLRLAIF
jgi:hypothetical protein